MRSLLLPLLLGALGLSGCAKPEPSPPSEHTGMGTVMKIGTGFWRPDSITHVSDYGFVKVLTPICDDGIAYVSEGMQADISFRWAELGCFKIDRVTIQPGIETWVCDLGAGPCVRLGGKVGKP